MRETKSDTETSSGSLIRGLTVVRLFTRGRPALMRSEIAAALGLPLPTVGRLAKTLLAAGFLESEPGTRRLHLGPEMRRLGGFVPQDATEEARRWMRQLNEQFDEDVNLALLDGAHALYVDTLATSRHLGIQTSIGSRAPAYCTAIGKALLAQHDDAVVRDRLGLEPYERRTERTIRRWSDLREELARIRTTGIARSFEEFEDGLIGLAVALGRGPGGVRFALSVAIPTVRATGERVSAIEAALLGGPTDRAQRGG